MDLKNTINNTNTQKENIKTVATQIDNKLVELGGEQATDLSDVANKIDRLVKKHKKKYLKYLGVNVESKKGINYGYNFTVDANFKIEQLIIAIELNDMQINLDFETANGMNETQQFWNLSNYGIIFKLHEISKNTYRLSILQGNGDTIYYTVRFILAIGV